MIGEEDLWHATLVEAIDIVNQKDSKRLQCLMTTQKYASYVPQLILLGCSFAHFAWFMDQGLVSVDHSNSDFPFDTQPTLLCAAIDRESETGDDGDMHAKIAFLIARGAELHTPLRCALNMRWDTSVTLLLKGGASLAALDESNRERVKREWFVGRKRCRLSVRAFLHCVRKRKRGVLMHKDVARLVARMLWNERYALCWYSESSRSSIKRRE